MDRPAAGAAGAAGGRGRRRPAHAAVLRRPGGRQPAGRAPGDPEAGAALSGGRTQFRTGRERGAERGALRRLQALRGRAGRPGRARAAHARRPEGRGRGRGAGALHAVRGHPRAQACQGRHGRGAAAADGAARAARLGLARTPVRAGAATPDHDSAGQPAAFGAPRRRHRQGLEGARLADRRLAGAASAGHAAVPGVSFSLPLGGGRGEGRPAPRGKMAG